MAGTRVQAKLTTEDTINVPGDAFGTDGDFTYIWNGDRPVAQMRTDSVLYIFLTTAKEA